MDHCDVAVVGGGAAGVFGAIACAENSPGSKVIVLESGQQFLSKVRISGGGRCNVTHACFDPRKLSENYPRGGQALIGLFHKFQPRDTIAWFEQRGVALKTEPDGRMFPVTDRSETIVELLLSAARSAGVQLVLNSGALKIEPVPGGGFDVHVRGSQQPLQARMVLLATGGLRGKGEMISGLGHTILAPVPSLFSFKLAEPWLARLAGITTADAIVGVPAAQLKQRGAFLVTHEGISGPAVLRASAWGAREMNAWGYTFKTRVNWMPEQSQENLGRMWNNLRRQNPKKQVFNTPVAGVVARLWTALCERAGISPGLCWSEVSNTQLHQLNLQLTACELSVIGKSLNKEEFVTCGGVPLKEVDFRTMESRVTPGLFLAGEVLDIDGVTGGFNFQAAWSTGWVAGRAMALRNQQK